MTFGRWAPRAAAALLIMAASCGRGKNEGPAPERFTVKRVDLRDVISQTGEVTPVVKVEIKSEASGKIEKIFVKEGQRVTRGQKILEIDPYKLNTRKKNLALSLQKARIQMEISARNYREAVELAGLGSVSDKDLQDLRSTKQLDSLSYAQEMLDMDDIDYQLSQTTVVSPLTGVLTELPVEEGEIAVSATSGYQSGTDIATVADISNLEVITQIGEVDYVHLELGQQVVIRPEALENVSTSGRIDFIALNAKKQSSDELGTFEVRIAIDSLVPGLAPGINVNVEFVVLDEQGVLGVPCHYVKKRGDRATVMVMAAPGAEPPARREQRPEGAERKRPGGGEGMPGGGFRPGGAPPGPRELDGGTAVPRRVELGATDFKHYEIKSGLKEGDVVVFFTETAAGDERKKGPGGGR